MALFTARCIFSVVAALLLLAAGGCKRSDPRVKGTIESLHWGGGTAEDRRVRDALLDALEKSTAVSLSKPQIVSSTVRAVPGNGILRVDWIGAAPASDALRVTLPDGTSADFPFDTVEIQNNEEVSKTLLFYTAAERAEQGKPQFWKQLAVAGKATAVLVQASKPVSNEMPVLFLAPSPPLATKPASGGKMIGAIDAKGQASIYVLQRDVKAGDKFSLADARSVPFSVEGLTGISSKSLLDTRGPAAYIGRPFLANHSANEMLATDMFSPAEATAPATTTK